MIGATFRAEGLRSAALRMAALAQRDAAALSKFGVAANLAQQITTDAEEVRRMMTDPLLKKHDTPLQMAELQELMAKIRGYLVEVREIAAINLSHDAPSIERITSNAPEIADGYARDLLRELEARMSALRDLRPRLEDSGVDDKLVSRGSKLVLQLKTAIGKEDVDSANLQFKIRRFYMTKGALYQAVKRVARAGRCAFRGDAKKRDEYHLLEIEPDPSTLS